MAQNSQFGMPRSHEPFDECRTMFISACPRSTIHSTRVVMYAGCCTRGAARNAAAQGFHSSWPRTSFRPPTSKKMLSNKFSKTDVPVVLWCVVAMHHIRKVTCFSVFAFCKEKQYRILENSRVRGTLVCSCDASHATSDVPCVFAFRKETQYCMIYPFLA